MVSIIAGPYDIKNTDTEPGTHLLGHRDEPKLDLDH